MKYDILLNYKIDFLRDNNIKQLQEMLNQAQASFLALRTVTSPHGRRVKHVTAPHLFKKAKKDIARIKTLIKEMQ